MSDEGLDEVDAVAMTVATGILADVAIDLLPLLIHLRKDKPLPFARFIRDAGLDADEVYEVMELGEMQAAIVEDIEAALFDDNAANDDEGDEAVAQSD